MSYCGSCVDTVPKSLADFDSFWDASWSCETLQRGSVIGGMEQVIFEFRTIHYRYVDTVHVKAMVTARTPMPHAFSFTNSCPVARIYDIDIKDCKDFKLSRKRDPSAKEERSHQVDLDVDVIFSSYESYRKLLFGIRCPVRFVSDC
jgi:hypothetical protein